MDGFWIYHTASADHHTNEDLSMIDEGDDCAYVIGNNVRHSGQFQKFYFGLQTIWL